MSGQLSRLKNIPRFVWIISQFGAPRHIVVEPLGIRARRSISRPFEIRFIKNLSELFQTKTNLCWNVEAPKNL